jgi:hypothetical protein
MKPSVFLFIVAFALNGTAPAQGPLTPPPGDDPSIGPVNALTAGGAPQAAMKTLHQFEPRTAIAGGTLSVTLSQSGAYYLTGDIYWVRHNGRELRNPRLRQRQKLRWVFDQGIILHRQCCSCQHNLWCSAFQHFFRLNMQRTELHRL